LTVTILRNNNTRQAGKYIQYDPFNPKETEAVPGREPGKNQENKYRNTCYKIASNRVNTQVILQNYTSNERGN
jgi:hypothetical protein